MAGLLPAGSTRTSAQFQNISGNTLPARRRRARSEARRRRTTSKEKETYLPSLGQFLV